MMSPSLALNLAAQLLDATRRWGDRPFIIAGSRSNSFTEVAARTADYAASFRALGVGPGARVAICLHPGVDTVAAFLGTLSLGAVACIVNSLLRPRQLAHVLQDVEPRVLVAEGDSLFDQRESLAQGLTLLDPSRVPVSAEPLAIMPVSIDTPALLVYTSGSTGPARGVLASHGNLSGTARVVASYLELDEEDRIGSVLPMSSVYGLSQVLLCLTTGASLQVVESVLPRDILSELAVGGVTVLPGIPPLWYSLLGVSAADASTPPIRAITNAGGHLAPAKVSELRSRWPRAQVFLMYGMTEVFRSTFLDPALVDEHPDSIGRPVPGSHVVVLREDGTPCEVGEVGELVHVGPSVALGYWRLPDETARVFRELPAGAGALAGRRGVFSGDLVRQDAEGMLYFVGRRDQMIKTMGYRVSPEEVTDALIATGMVTEAAVTAAPDPRRGQRILAHVSPRDGATVAAIMEALRIELPSYMRPASYQVYDALPRTPAGKIDMMRLDGAPAERAARLPSTRERQGQTRRNAVTILTADTALVPTSCESPESRSGIPR